MTKLCDARDYLADCICELRMFLIGGRFPWVPMRRYIFFLPVSLQMLYLSHSEHLNFPWCTIKSRKIGGHLGFSINPGKPNTDKDFKPESQREYHPKKSSSQKVPMNMIKYFLKDSMRRMFLGNIKSLAIKP